MNNNFRKSQDIQLTSVPTLIKVGTVSCAVLFSPAFCCFFPFTGYAQLKLLVCSALLDINKLYIQFLKSFNKE